MYVQLIKDLRETYEEKLKKIHDNENKLNFNLNRIKMSLLGDNRDDISVNSASSSDMFMYENIKSTITFTNSSNEPNNYKDLIENIDQCELEYKNFKNNLIENEFELCRVVEEKLDQIFNLKIDLLKSKYTDELNLKVTSTKLVMEKLNLASIQWSNEEFDKKLLKMKHDLDLNDKKLFDYEKIIDDLNRKLKACKKDETNKENNEIKSIEDDMDSDNYEPISILNSLRDEIQDKNDLIEHLKKNEENYLEEINHLKNQLNQVFEIQNTSSNRNLINFETEMSLFDTTNETVYRDHKLLSPVKQVSNLNEIRDELLKKDSQIEILSNELENYEKLKEELETMTHPAFIELQNELQKNFYEDYEDLKHSYENKLREELEIYRSINEQRIEAIQLENKKLLKEIETKHKLEIYQLETEFNRVLSSDLNDLKKELEKTQKENQGVDIKFRYSTEHCRQEIFNLNSSDLDHRLHSENEFKDNPLNSYTLKSVSITKLEDEEKEEINENNYTNVTKQEKEINTANLSSTSIIEQMPLNNYENNNNSSSSFTEDDEPNTNSYNKVETAITNDLNSANGSNKVIDFEHETLIANENYILELEDKIKQLEQKNKTLQGTLESLYEKDDVFMASSRRENEERENYIKLLQSDITNINEEKNQLQVNNQNLLNLLSKTYLITTSIDDHINRRLNKLINTQDPKSHQSRINSPKSAHLSSLESGLAASDDADSHEDVSEEALDTSQRFYDLFLNNDFSDDTLIDTNLKVQSSIDKLFSMLDETSKQLTESNSLQVQLAFKFDENKKQLDDFKTRYQNLVYDYEEKIDELQKKINNLEGLVDAYESDIHLKKNLISQLELNLNETRQELTCAKYEIENEKTEVSNLETVRKDLEAQRSFYTNNIQDSDIKVLEIATTNSSTELIQNNSLLLDEKHQLEYKLNKTNEISQQQIKDLEETVENFNVEIKLIEKKYEEQLDDLKRQINSMDSQIKSDKAFIELQMTEREQEREDYEAKINELKQLLTRKSNQFLDDEKDTSFKERKEFEDMLQEKISRINELTIENENLEKDLNEKEENLLKLNKQLKDLEFKIENLNKERSNSNMQIEQFKEEIDTLLKSNKNHSNTINDLREKVNELQIKYDSQLEQNESWLHEKEDLVQEKNNLQSELFSYMSRVSDLQLHKENIEMDLKNKLNKAEEQVSSLSSSIEEKEDQIEKLKEQLNELKEDFQNRIEAEINQLKYEEEKNQDELLKTYENQIEAHKKEIEDLKSELQSKVLSQSLVDSKNEQIDDLNSKIEELQNENKNIKESGRKYELENEDLKNEILGLNERYENEKNSLKDDYKSQIESLNDQIENFDIEKSAISTQNESLKTEVLNLKEINEEYRDKIEKITIENKTFKQEIEQSSELISSKEEMINKLNDEINYIKMSLIEAETKINNYKNDLSKLEQERQTDEDLRFKYDEILSEKETFEQTLNNYKEKNESLSLDIMNKLNDMNSLEKEIEKLRLESNEFDLENNKLNELNENLKKKNESLKQELEIIEKEKQDLTHLVEELNSKLETINLNHKINLDSQIQEIYSKHKSQLDEMVHLNENQLSLIKLEHANEIEHLTKEHEKQLAEEIEKVRNEYQKRIDELKEIYEKDETDDSEKATSVDVSITNDNFKKLKEQIQLSKKLDNDILDKVTEKLSSSGSQEEDKSSHSVPVNIRDILEKLDNEGVLLLSLSEILTLKNHLKNTNSPFKQDIEIRLAETADQNEKNNLIQEIYQLKELISKISSNNDLNLEQNNDWRSEFMNAISKIFTNQKEFIIAELRSFVSTNSYLDNNKYLEHLENKIDDLKNLHKKSNEYLESIDRETLLNEMNSIKNELSRVLNELNSLQENERELKREIKLIEYARDAEEIKSNDLKQSLNNEKTKCFELIEKLNQEKKKTTLMQEQLCDLNEEVVKIKEHLNSETNNLQIICKELETEKSKNEQLKNLLEETKSKQNNFNDENEFRKEISINRLYLKESNSGDLIINSNSNKKFQVLEQQFIELEKHTNNLDQLLIQEKSKNEKLLMAYNELKQKYISLGSLNNGSNVERIKQSLEYLTVRYSNELESFKNLPHLNELKSVMNSMINEIENIANSLSSQSDNGNDLEMKLLKQNRDLLNMIKKLTNDKFELKNLTQRLEEELWALKSKAKNEMNKLTEHDKEKFKKLYFKYLRAESFRKSLVYQKKFLLIMLSGYEETEREIMATLKLETNRTGSSTSSRSIMYNQEQAALAQKNNSSFYYSNRFTVQKAKSRFRTGAICIIAINRIKFLQRKHSYMLSRVDTYRSS